jgi:hypothetical protein
MTDQTTPETPETPEADESTLGERIEAAAGRFSENPVAKAVNDEIDRIDEFVDEKLHRHSHEAEPAAEDGDGDTAK